MEKNLVFKNSVDEPSTVHTLWLCCNDSLRSTNVCARFCRLSCLCRRKRRNAYVK